MGLQLKDFYGVKTPNPPVTRVHCPLLAWFGTKEPEIGTVADLELLKSTLQRLPTGPQSRRHLHDPERRPCVPRRRGASSTTDRQVGEYPYSSVSTQKRGSEARIGSSAP